MRYTYLFTQISREENGSLVDKPHEFVFTFGRKIDQILGKSQDNTVRFTKNMWKEYPTKNEEILPCVCFSAPSQQGFRRPLVLSKDTDERVGVYKYALVYENEVTEGKCLSDDIRRLTETFVNGVRAINDNTRTITWENLEKANIRYLMSYIKSEAYKQLLQDKDNRGKEKAEDYLKNV